MRGRVTSKGLPRNMCTLLEHGVVGELVFELTANLDDW